MNWHLQNHPRKYYFFLNSFKRNFHQNSALKLLIQSFKYILSHFLWIYSLFYSTFFLKYSWSLIKSAPFWVQPRFKVFFFCNRDRDCILKISFYQVPYFCLRNGGQIHRWRNFTRVIFTLYSPKRNLWERLLLINDHLYIVFWFLLACLP